MDKQLLDYFIAETNKKFDKLDSKIDQLLKFKWQIVGGSVIFSMLITILIQIVFVYVNKT